MCRVPFIVLVTLGVLTALGVVLAPKASATNTAVVQSETSPLQQTDVSAPAVCKGDFQIQGPDGKWYQAKPEFKRVGFTKAATLRSSVDPNCTTYEAGVDLTPMADAIWLETMDKFVEVTADDPEPSATPIAPTETPSPAATETPVVQASPVPSATPTVAAPAPTRGEQLPPIIGNTWLLTVGPNDVVEVLAFNSQLTINGVKQGQAAPGKALLIGIFLPGQYGLTDLTPQGVAAATMVNGYANAQYTGVDVLAEPAIAKSLSALRENRVACPQTCTITIILFGPQGVIRTEQR